MSTNSKSNNVWTLVRYLPEWLPWFRFPRVAKEVQKISHAVLYDMSKKAMVFSVHYIEKDRY